MATPESKVKDKVKKTLSAFNAYYFMPIGGMYSKIGVPDIICCYKGHFVAIECKAGKNKPTALQERELKIIRDAGGYALVVNEENIDDVRKLLESIDGL
jgi:hypothetical protein